MLSRQTISLIGAIALLAQACAQPPSDQAAIVAEAKCAAADGEMVTTGTSNRPRCIQLAPEPDLYPAKVEAFVLKRAPDEPRLWQEKAVQGYAQRLRMLEVWLPPSEAVLVRIDTDTSGASTGDVVRLRRIKFTSDWTFVERRQFSVSDDSLARLNNVVRQADLPKKGNFRGEGEEEDSCTDGLHVIIERATPAEGYEFAAGNLRCGKTPSVEAIVAEMRTMAGMR